MLVSLVGPRRRGMLSVVSFSKNIIPARANSTQSFSIRASQNELRNGRLNEHNLELAVRSVFHNGLVVIENAIDHHRLDRLNERMLQDSEYLSSLGTKSPFNFNKGNLQQDAPPTMEHFEPAIFLNPLATQISSTVLGPRPKLTFMSGNAAIPATAKTPPQRQPVHSDADFAHPSHPFALVVNVPLIEMGPENGSTEIWLGTHSDFGIEAQEGSRGERTSGRIKEDFLAKRKMTHPPIQPLVPKGSIVLRDLRLWHAGMPNLSRGARIMLAMIHFAPWYRNQMRLELSESLSNLIEKEDGLDIRVEYIPECEAKTKYLHRGFGNTYDFSQVN